MAMTHGSLFSGIGGFDLAAEWMGWENKFHCEWNEFGQKVLHYYWPKAELFTDITKSNFTKYANKIDILTGGFPCQPYSSAGKRLGKEDSRHLWPEMLRVIREVRPRWVVGENVRGLTNWNGGLVFDEVQADLEAIGYEVTPFLLPACAVNAPHRRDRIWFIAYNHSFRFKRYAKQVRYRNDSTEQYWNNKFCKKQGWNEIRSINERNCEDWNATNTDSDGQQWSDSENEIDSSEGRVNALGNTNKSNGDGDAINTESKGLERQYREWDRCTEHWQDKGLFIRSENKFNVADTSNEGCQQCGISRQISKEKRISNGERSEFGISFETMGNVIKSNWQNFPTVSPICIGDDGLSSRLDSITFPKWRTESIKAGGNAIVPQVALQIFKAIEQYELILQNA